MTEPQVVAKKFTFKFDRNENVHQEALEKKKELLEQYISDHPFKSKIEKIELFPVERVGESGSNVFYLNVFINGRQNPERNVAKFQGSKNTGREYESSIEAVSRSICQAVFATHKNDQVIDEDGLIVYRFVKLNHATAMEFRAFYVDNSFSCDQCVEVLRKLYELSLPVPDEMRLDGRVKLIDSYERYYIKRGVAPLDKLRKISLDVSSDLGKKARRVYEFQKLLKVSPIYKDIEVSNFLQHGDLHARNFLIDPEKLEEKPEIIDFGWTTGGHCARDFVILEATLKYMLINEFLSHKGNGYEDKHASPLSYISFEKYLCSQGFELPEFDDSIFTNRLSTSELDAFRRAYRCIRVIRKNAKKYLSLSIDSVDRASCITEDKEYLIALFLVSIGLVAFGVVNDYWIVLGGDILIDHIQDLSEI